MNKWLVDIKISQVKHNYLTRGGRTVPPYNANMMVNSKVTFDAFKLHYSYEGVCDFILNTPGKFYNSRLICFISKMLDN